MPRDAKETIKQGRSFKNAREGCCYHYTARWKFVVELTTEHQPWGSFIRIKSTSGGKASTKTLISSGTYQWPGVASCCLRRGSPWRQKPPYHSGLSTFAMTVLFLTIVRDNSNRKYSKILQNNSEYVRLVL